jgi:hypothetical protein
VLITASRVAYDVMRLSGAVLIGLGLRLALESQ